ncbi:MAG: hypothetical protein LBB53_02945, partial [Prevotellaceae bacterium]|nr:hypothetical protein [Prevotellaceae bacterium]
MLRIILQDGTGEFELPENFAVEMFLNNVMLADAGEQTLPMTLPPTSHNLKLVKWGHRLDSRYKPLYSLNVNISEGVFFQKCRMEIFSISEVEGISCSMYFNNGGFYSEVHKKNVWDFDWGEITYTERLSLSNPQNSELYSMILDKVRRDGYVFPQVVSTNEFKRRILYLNTEAISGPAHQITSVEPVEGLIILNEYDIIHNRNIDFSTTYNTLISLVGELSDPLFVYSAENSDDNSEGVLQRLPYNFGLAPFMYFGVFLETFFTLAGYRFSYNDDFVHFYPWFQHIILL